MFLDISVQASKISIIYAAARKNVCYLHPTFRVLFVIPRPAVYKFKSQISCYSSP